jgi:hypothetical protein
MRQMIILKAGWTAIFYMDSQLDVNRKTSEQPSEEEEVAIRSKASIYALLNRPSPPF